jgi:hypothetical protein
MEQNIIRKDMWNIAAKAGLALGLTSTVYMFATQLISGASGFMISISSFILWAAKFSGCIMLMKFFMGKFAESHPEVTNRDTFRLGSLSALLSAFVFAAFSFANVAFLFPDLFTEEMNAAIQQMAPALDSNSLSMIEKTMENLPQLTFFGNLTYCFIYGVILSLILSRSIPTRDLFADHKSE